MFPSLLGPQTIVRPVGRGFPIFYRTLFSRAAKTVTQNKIDRNATSSSNVDATGYNSNLANHPAVRKFPKFMRKYAVRFAGAPVSHATAFLILHEASAVAPLFGFWWIFHHYDFVPPMDFVPEWLLENGTKFIKVLGVRNEWTDIINADATSKIIVEGAAAYALVKVLLPVRIALSLYLMPWFARVAVLPITNMFSSITANIKAKQQQQATPKKPSDEEAIHSTLKNTVETKKRDPEVPQL